MDPGELSDADLLDALNEAQRAVPPDGDANHRRDAWQLVVALMRELERRYPPGSLPEESPDSNGDRIASRAQLLPEEVAAGSENAGGLAEAVLADSDERSADRDAAPGSSVEHRTSAEATGPPEVSGP